MAESIPPPPPPPPLLPAPLPPEAPNPTDGTEEWHKQEETRGKRKAYGAGIGFLTGEKIRTFIIEMSFPATEDQASINMHTPHKAFITALFENAEGGCQLMPTAKSKDDPTDGAQSTKSPIISIDSFLSTTYSHAQFFDKVVYFQPNTNRTVAKITHKVMMKDTVTAMKSKLMAET
jgi:hypothetical protein